VTSGGVKVQVKGDDVLARTLRSAGRDLQDWAQVNASAAARVAQDAQGRAPRRTGRLAGSIRPSSDKTSGTIVAGGGGIAYAKVIEYGSQARNIRAQPYLRPAFQELRDALIGMYDQHMKSAIGHVKGA
jgi:HK97 gp10 family phage protein